MEIREGNASMRDGVLWLTPEHEHHSRATRSDSSDTEYLPLNILCKALTHILLILVSQHRQGLQCVTLRTN